MADNSTKDAKIAAEELKKKEAELAAAKAEAEAAKAEASKEAEDKGKKGKDKKGGTVTAIYRDASARAGEDIPLYLNGRLLLMKKNEEVELPEAYAEILQNSQAQELVAIKTRDELKNEE